MLRMTQGRPIPRQRLRPGQRAFPQCNRDYAILRGIKNLLRDIKRRSQTSSLTLREHGRLIDAQKNLTAAQDRESRQRLQEQQRAASAHERRMSAITGKLSHHDELHTVTFTAIEKLKQIPERICVEWHCRNSYFRLPARTLVWGGGDHCSMIGPARGGLVVNEPSLV